MNWSVFWSVAEILVLGYLTYAYLDKAIRYRETTVAGRSVSRLYFIAIAVLCGTAFAGRMIPGFSGAFLAMMALALGVAAVEYFRSPLHPEVEEVRNAASVPGGTTLL